jgi:hypothetical protein
MVRGQKPAAAKEPAKDSVPAKESGPSASRLLTKEEITKHLTSGQDLPPSLVAAIQRLNPWITDELTQPTGGVSRGVLSKIESAYQQRQEAAIQFFKDWDEQKKVAAAVLEKFKEKIVAGDPILLVVLVRICDQEGWTTPDWLKDAVYAAYVELTTTGRQGNIPLAKLMQRADSLHEAFTTLLVSDFLTEVRKSKQTQVLFLPKQKTSDLLATMYGLSSEGFRLRIRRAKKYLATTTGTRERLAFGINDNGVEKLLTERSREI